MNLPRAARRAFTQSIEARQSHRSRRRARRAQQAVWRWHPPQPHPVLVEALRRDADRKR